MKQIKTRKLYHLSTENHNGETFIPRIPVSRASCEDEDIKRVCFSTTMAGAFRAIHENLLYGNSMKLYVHVPAKPPKRVMKPDETEVYDVDVTGERWVLEKVRMKCIGCAVFYGYDTIWETDFPANVVIHWIDKKAR